MGAGEEENRKSERKPTTISVYGKQKRRGGETQSGQPHAAESASRATQAKAHRERSAVGEGRGGAAGVAGQPGAELAVTERLYVRKTFSPSLSLSLSLRGENAKRPASLLPRALRSGGGPHRRARRLSPLPRRRARGSAHRALRRGSRARGRARTSRRGGIVFRFRLNHKIFSFRVFVSEKFGCFYCLVFFIHGMAAALPIFSGYSKTFTQISSSHFLRIPLRFAEGSGLPCAASRPGSP